MLAATMQPPRPTSTAVQEIPGSNGATAPVWPASGTSLVYEAGDALWLVPALAGRPVKIAMPLFPVNNWPTYYGEIGWAQQFAWSAAR
jgi:hypothetical protein